MGSAHRRKPSPPWPTDPCVHQCAIIWPGRRALVILPTVTGFSLISSHSLLIKALPFESKGRRSSPNPFTEGFAMAAVGNRRLPQLHLTLELPETAAAVDCGVRFALPPLPAAAAALCSSSSSSSLAPSTELRVSDFEKIRVLGHGNGGTVHRVRHRRSAAVYALKVVRADPLLRRQAYREIDILRRASDCNHVVRLHSVITTPSGDVSFLLEHMDGGSLDALLRRRGSRPFPESALASIARQALLGLAELHSRQIVHRDIKPANLLINSVGVVKIADFGVGKVLRRSLDPCDSYVGTCAYMSPERFDPASHGGDYDPYAADVWSLGLAVLELHRGHFPLLPEGAQPDWAALMVAICLGGAIGTVAEGAASGEFREFIECCLQKESGKRWSVADLLGHPFVARADGIESERALRELVRENSVES
ncbi:hypothetical protein ZIOFF_030854 [Zingiber officinale]|uniref:mitogen-activated protein kinase kinase n=2 Tax=Zingiber officinale TaxID=94328 RepID=A0A8J5L595_ZINOF|nr:hypothetical protein ZIOFF_030854 [Zingiber officinale]